MDFKSSKGLAHFDSCIFVCTPDQVRASCCTARRDKCPLNGCVFCCTSPNMSNRCVKLILTNTQTQGNFPKCPFGACCSSESRKDECSTCSTLWCNPDKEDCPLNKDHKQYPLYCGKTDSSYIDFLKTLRERVEARARVDERDTHSLVHLRGERRIDEQVLRGYQQLYKNNFQNQNLKGALKAQKRFPEEPVVGP